MSYKGVKEHSRQPSHGGNLPFRGSFSGPVLEKSAGEWANKVDDGSPVESNGPQKVVINISAGLCDKRRVV
jgi:hypothetical protein